MLKINKNIEIFPFNEKATLYDKCRKIEFSVGKTELEVIKFILVNEPQSIEKIEIDISQKYLEQIINILQQKGIIENDNIKYQKKFNFSWCIFNYDLLKKSKIHLDKLAIFSGIFPIICVIFSFVIYFFKKSIVFFEDVSFFPGMIISAYIGCCVSLFFHELFHAIFARKFGVHIVEVGIMFKFIFPCIYLRLVGLPLCKKIHKIIIYFGGMYCHIMMIAIAISLKLIFSQFSRISAIFTIFGMINLLLLCLNGLPIFQLDGHKIYLELLNESTIVNLLKVSNTDKVLFFVSNIIIILCTILGEIFSYQFIGIILLILQMIVFVSFIKNNNITFFCIFSLSAFFTIRYIFMLIGLIYNNMTLLQIVINSVAFLLIANITTLVMCSVCYFFKARKDGNLC